MKKATVKITLVSNVPYTDNESSIWLSVLFMLNGFLFDSSVLTWQH